MVTRLQQIRHWRTIVLAFCIKVGVDFYSAQRLDLFAWCVRLSRLLDGFRTHFKKLHSFIHSFIHSSYSLSRANFATSCTDIAARSDCFGGRTAWWGWSDQIARIDVRRRTAESGWQSPKLSRRHSATSPRFICRHKNWPSLRDNCCVDLPRRPR